MGERRLFGQNPKEQQLLFVKPSLMAKNGVLSPNGPLWGHFHTTGCLFLASFASRAVPPHVFHFDPLFVLLHTVDEGGGSYSLKCGSN